MLFRAYFFMAAGRKPSPEGWNVYSPGCQPGEYGIEPLSSAASIGFVNGVKAFAAQRETFSKRKQLNNQTIKQPNNSTIKQIFVHAFFQKFCFFKLLKQNPSRELCNFT